MNKKGFTLLELLGVIIILAIVSSFAFVSIVSMSKKTTENKELYDTIYIAAESYVYNNYSMFTDLDDRNVEVRINAMDLINNGYLKKTTINPKTGEVFTSADYIVVQRASNMTLSFEIE